MLDVILAATLQTRVPFQLVDNRIVVTAAVNGTRGFAMILDTGSNGVALTPQAAAQLHLTLKRGPLVGGAGAGRAQTYRAQIGNLQLGTYGTGKMPVLVVSLDAIRKKFGFPRLDGIIGYDALRARYTALDVDDRFVTISSAPPKAPPGAHAVPFTVQDGLIVVQGAVDGVHGDLMVDTGDRSALTVFQRFASANGFYALSMSARNVVTGYGIGGPIRGDLFTTTANVFGFTVPGVVARAPLGNAGVFSTSSLMGSIGNRLLRRFNTIFDWQAHTIAAWPARAPPNADSSSAAAVPSLPRHGTFGTVLANGPQGALVSRVLPDSAAAAAGIQAGDVLTSLSGVATPDAAAFLAQIHRFHAGDRVSVGVRRGESTRQYAVVLGAPASEHAPGLTTAYESIVVDGTLRRTLITAPAAVSHELPAMLILGGIGCYSVDAASNPQDAYMNLAQDVSRAGFVTMRVEKSGVGDSEGPPCRSVDFEAEQRAYAAALAALLADPRVDRSQVYLLGHSIGSLEAPMLANMQHVAGIIVAEAVGRDWPEYELRNARRQLELSGATPAAVDEALIGKQECLVRLLLEKQSEALIEQTQPECKTHNGIYPVDPPYMQQVARVNVIAQWARVGVPVLAIYGTSDFVTEQADHERIVAVLNADRPGAASFVPIAGMDHLLFTASTVQFALAALGGTTPREYDRDLSRAVVRWLCAHAPCTENGSRTTAAPE